MAEWDEYCHYVAGLVGIGLSCIFAASNLEDSVVGKDQVLANSMGLFLQKTNIVRDYLEDIVQGRKFWPKEVCVSVSVCLSVLLCMRESILYPPKPDLISWPYALCFVQLFICVFESMSLLPW